MRRKKREKRKKGEKRRREKKTGRSKEKRRETRERKRRKNCPFFLRKTCQNARLKRRIPARRSLRALLLVREGLSFPKRKRLPLGFSPGRAERGSTAPPHRMACEREGNFPLSARNPRTFSTGEISRSSRLRCRSLGRRAGWSCSADASSRSRSAAQKAERPY